MNKNESSLQIGFLIYPDMIQLDALGAYQVLAFSPQAKLHLIWKTPDPIVSNEGLMLVPSTTITNCPPLDVVCVPGGSIGQIAVMQDAEILSFLKDQAIQAQYVTSVCTGSLILAAAGLLQGYKATCHWAFRSQLATLGVEVIPQRVVIDRDRITAAGVTAGIDLGLRLLALLSGEQTAKMAQLMLEYAPEPPFAGTPEADHDVVEALMQLGQPLLKAFSAQIKTLP